MPRQEYTVSFIFHFLNIGGRGRGRGREFSEFKVSLIYRVSFRTARTTQRNPASNIKRKK